MMAAIYEETGIPTSSSLGTAAGKWREPSEVSERDPGKRTTVVASPLHCKPGIDRRSIVITQWTFTTQSRQPMLLSTACMGGDIIVDMMDADTSSGASDSGDKLCHPPPCCAFVLAGVTTGHCTRAERPRNGRLLCCVRIQYGGHQELRYTEGSGVRVVVRGAHSRRLEGRLDDVQDNVDLIPTPTSTTAGSSKQSREFVLDLDSVPLPPGDAPPPPPSTVATQESGDGPEAFTSLPPAPALPPAHPASPPPATPPSPPSVAVPLGTPDQEKQQGQDWTPPEEEPPSLAKKLLSKALGNVSRRERSSSPSAAEESSAGETPISSPVLGKLKFSLKPTGGMKLQKVSFQIKTKKSTKSMAELFRPDLKKGEEPDVANIMMQGSHSTIAMQAAALLEKARAEKAAEAAMKKSSSEEDRSGLDVSPLEDVQKQRDENSGVTKDHIGTVPADTSDRDAQDQLIPDKRERELVQNNKESVSPTQGSGDAMQEKLKEGKKSRHKHHSDDRDSISKDKENTIPDRSRSGSEERMDSTQVEKREQNQAKSSESEESIKKKHESVTETKEKSKKKRDRSDSVEKAGRDGAEEKSSQKDEAGKSKSDERLDSSSRKERSPSPPRSERKHRRNRQEQESGSDEETVTRRRSRSPARNQPVRSRRRQSSSEGSIDRERVPVRRRSRSRSFERRNTRRQQDSDSDEEWFRRHAKDWSRDQARRHYKRRNKMADSSDDERKMSSKSSRHKVKLERSSSSSVKDVKPSQDPSASVKRSADKSDNSSEKPAAEASMHFDLADILLPGEAPPPAPGKPETEGLPSDTVPAKDSHREGSTSDKGEEDMDIANSDAEEDSAHQLGPKMVVTQPSKPAQAGRAACGAVETLKDDKEDVKAKRIQLDKISFSLKLSGKSMKLKPTQGVENLDDETSGGIKLFLPREEDIASVSAGDSQTPLDSVLEKIRSKLQPKPEPESETHSSGIEKRKHSKHAESESVSDSVSHHKSSSRKHGEMESKDSPEKQKGKRKDESERDNSKSDSKHLSEEGAAKSKSSKEKDTDAQSDTNEVLGKSDKGDDAPLQNVLEVPSSQLPEDDKPRGRLFKYEPLWELEKEEKKSASSHQPVIVQASTSAAKTQRQTIPLATLGLDYGSSSEDDSEGSLNKSPFKMSIQKGSRSVNIPSSLATIDNGVNIQRTKPEGKAATDTPETLRDVSSRQAASAAVASASDTESLSKSSLTVTVPESRDKPGMYSPSSLSPVNSDNGKSSGQEELHVKTKHSGPEHLEAKPSLETEVPLTPTDRSSISHTSRHSKVSPPKQASMTEDQAGKSVGERILEAKSKSDLVGQTTPSVGQSGDSSLPPLKPFNLPVTDAGVDTPDSLTPTLDERPVLEAQEVSKVRPEHSDIRSRSSPATESPKPRRPSRFDQMSSKSSSPATKDTSRYRPPIETIIAVKPSATKTTPPSPSSSIGKQADVGKIQIVIGRKVASLKESPLARDSEDAAPGSAPKTEKGFPVQVITGTRKPDSEESAEESESEKAETDREESRSSKEAKRKSVEEGRRDSSDSRRRDRSGSRDRRDSRSDRRRRDDSRDRSRRDESDRKRRREDDEKQRHRSDSRGRSRDQSRDRSPDRSRDRSPDRNRERSPERARNRSPHRGWNRSPDRSRDRSPERRRVWSPQRNRDRSPARGQSPDRNRDLSPDRTRMRSPQRSRDWSPDRRRVPSPDRIRDQSPGMRRNWSPDRPRGVSPQRRRDWSLERRDQSPDRLRASVGDKVRDWSPGRGRDWSPERNRGRERQWSRSPDRRQDVDVGGNRNRDTGQDRSPDLRWQRARGDSRERSPDRSWEHGRSRIPDRQREQEEERFRRLSPERRRDRSPNFSPGRSHPRDRRDNRDRPREDSWDRARGRSDDRVHGRSPGRAREESLDSSLDRSRERMERGRRRSRSPSRERDREPPLKKAEERSSRVDSRATRDLERLTGETQGYASDSSSSQQAVPGAPPVVYQADPALAAPSNFGVPPGPGQYPEGYVEGAPWPPTGYGPPPDPAVLQGLQQQYQAMGYPPEQAQHFLFTHPPQGHPPQVVPPHDPGAPMLMDPSGAVHMPPPPGYPGHFPPGVPMPPGPPPHPGFGHGPPPQMDYSPHMHHPGFGQEMYPPQYAEGVMVTGPDSQFPYESVAEMEAHLRAEMHPDPREAALFGDLPSVRRPRSKRARLAEKAREAGAGAADDKTKQQTAVNSAEPSFENSAYAEPGFETSQVKPVSEAKEGASGSKSDEEKDQEKLLRDSEEVVSSTNSSEGMDSPMKDDQLSGTEPRPLKRLRMEAEAEQQEAEKAGDSYPVFEEISENIHLTERKKSKSMKRMVCDCTTSKSDRAMGIPACGPDCLNRMLMIECGSRCPCLDYCTNKRFQKKQYIKTEAFNAGVGKGWGLRAAEDLQDPGAFVMEYVGELLDYKEFVRRTRQYAKQGMMHHYFMALNADEVIDATQKGSTSRFMNHSCDPNCETQKWTVNGELRVGFFTKKPVTCGEELTFDYQFEFYGEPQKCYCGSENCRGFIGSIKNQPVQNKKVEKRTADLFEDDMLDDDIESMMRLENGMQNQKHVLEVCRLMVRAEKPEHRLSILRIIQDTNEICLRLFLGYHGLPLLWSWMVDVGLGDAEDDRTLRKEMLSVLKKLPITNRTILKESKIMTIVEKVSSTNGDGSGEGQVTTTDSPLARTSSEEEQMKATTSEKEDGVSEPVTETSESEKSEPVSSAGENTDGKTDADEAKQDGSQTRRRSSRRAQKLPAEVDVGEGRALRRRGRKSNSSEERSEAVDSTSQKEEAAEAKTKDSSDGESSSSATDSVPVGSTSTEGEAGSEGEKDQPAVPAEPAAQEAVASDGLASSLEPSADSSAGKSGVESVTSEASSAAETDNSFGTAPLAQSTEDDDATYVQQKNAEEVVSSNGDESPPMEESDDAFASMESGDLGPMDEISTMAADLLSGWSELKNLWYSKSQNDDKPDPYAKWKKKKVDKPKKRDSDDDESKKRSLLATPQGPRLTKEERRQLFEAQVKAEDELAAERAQMQRQQMEAFLQQQFFYQDPAFAAMHGLTPDPNLLAAQGQVLDPNMPFNAGLLTPEQQQAAMLLVSQGVVGADAALAAQQILAQQNLYQQEQYQQMSGAYSQGQPGQVYQNPTSLTPQQQQQQQMALQQMALQQMAALQQQTGVPGGEEEDVPPPPSPPKASSTTLPPNWKTARDAEGRLYYYHTVTRQTQWEPPAWERNSPEDMDFDLPEPELEEDKKRKMTTTAAADTSSEVAKKIKEQFRRQMSQHIVVYLNPYRKPDCKIGRIVSTEDFKHLARKLTHHVMAKELKHCRHVEDLEVNENVKAKAKDYVRKYMSRYGPEFKTSSSPQLDDFGL
ncbi:hypothetical protein BaRGS_00002143 [Batillaria attramentaria]|uniref:[histone H3]-lysine(36) N-trimethyltransferase n=1 Tax=Batillaria attramentaria TaxID=370345 RepID=A0ABD0M5E6_9CAEN